jgi:hypothetical protein
MDEVVAFGLHWGRSWAWSGKLAQILPQLDPMTQLVTTCTIERSGEHEADLETLYAYNE